MRRARYVTLLGAALLIAGPMAVTVDAATAGYGQSTDDIGQADLKVDWLCGSGTKNEIKISGPVKLRNIGVSVRFDATGNRSNRAFADDADGIDLDIAGGITRAKSPNAGGAGGNPWVFLQPRSANGLEDVGEPILLGRCKGNSMGSARAQARLAAGIASLLSLGGAGCSNSGSSINTERRHGRGIKAQLILSNKLDMTGHKSNPEEVAINDITFGDAGAPKRGNISNGVGGNPSLHVLFWKVKKNADGTMDNVRPIESNGSFTYSDGSAADIYSTVSDAAGAAKGWRGMGRCTDLK